MIASIETTLEPKMRFNAFTDNRVVSEYSIPVSNVEAYLNKHPEKRDTSDPFEIRPIVAYKKSAPKVVKKSMNKTLQARASEQVAIHLRRIERIKELLLAGELVTHTKLDIAESTLGANLCKLRNQGWDIKRTSDGYLLIRAGK